MRLNDKREYKAKLVGSDPRSDVAVVKVEATNLPAMKIGDVSKLRVGEWVIAIGSPFGFANSVTAGIVSAKSRDNLPTANPNQDAVPFIQTDVAVNPGQLGGGRCSTCAAKWSASTRRSSRAREASRHFLRHSHRLRVQRRRPDHQDRPRDARAHRAWASRMFPATPPTASACPSPKARSSATWKPIPRRTRRACR